MNSIMGRFLCAFIFLFFGSSAWASSGITYQGRLLDPNNVPVTSSNVQFKIQIRTPGVEDCLLYEEIQTIDLSVTSGVFALSVGDGTGTRTDAHAADWNLFESLSNRKSFNFSSADCAGVNTYTPNPADNRKFRVFFNLGSGWESLPVQTINYIPMSIETYAVGGFPASSLFRVEDAGALGNVAALTTTQYNNLVSLANGSSSVYEKSGHLGGSILPSLTSGQTLLSDGSGGWTAGVPVDATVESFARSSLPICTAGEVLYSDGSSLSCVTDTSGGSLSESDIPKLTSAGNGVDGGAISGTIGGSTVINTSGDITTTGNLSVTGSTTMGSFSTRQFDLYESTNTHKISFLAPSALSDYTLTFPVDDGVSGQVLSTNGSGTLSWISPSTGSVTGVSGTSPIVVDNSNPATPIVTLSDSGVGAATYGDATTVPRIEVDAKGIIQSVTNTTISGVSPVGSALSTGKVWVGDANKAQERFLSISDIRSTALGNNAFFPLTCTNAQTLVWKSPDDVFECTDISISSTKVSGLGTAAAKDFGTNAGELVELDTGGKIPSALLPAISYDATYFKQGGNSFSAAATLGTTDNHDLNFITNNTTKMTVLANGNIGIGTTDASEMLTISGPDGKIRIQRFDDTYGPDIYLAKSNGTMASPVAVTSDQVAGSLHVQAYNGTNIRNLSSIVTLADDDQIVGSSPGRLEFRTTPVGSNTSVTRMTIKSNGNIGIGTTAPAAKLTVQDPTSTTPLLIMGNSTGSNINFNELYPNTDRAYFGYNPTSGNAYFFNVNPTGAFTIGTANTGRIHIDSSGNVGIGTTTPSEKLEVDGKVKGTELCIGTDCRSNWPSAGGSGTVTSVASGTGLTGGPITSTGTLSLANTAVTPGSYGSSSSVGTFTVDAQGRLTAASNTAIGSLNASVLTAGTLGAARMPAFTGGDVTSSAGSGVLSIGAGKVTASKLGSDVGLWSVSGSDVYRASGNVGIGTADPAAPLHVETGGLALRLSNGPGVVDFKVGNNGNLYIQNEGTLNHVELFVDTDLVGTAYGWLGTGKAINTANVGTLLGIDGRAYANGSGDISNAVGVVGENYVWGATGNISSMTAIGASGVTYGGGSTATIENAYGVKIAPRGHGTYRYGVYQEGPDANYFGGNVGIGTKNPDHHLEVAGLGGAGKMLQLHRTADLSTSSLGSRINFSFNDSSVEADRGYLEFVANNTTTVDDGASFNVGLANPSGTIENRLSIVPSGNVGIGTTLPSEKLEVVGKVKATEFCIGNNCQSSWPSGGSSQWADGASSSINYTAGNVGIGTTNPANLLNLVSNTSAVLKMEQYSSNTGGPGIEFRKARGSTSAPSVILKDDALGTLLFRGYSSTAFSNAGRAMIQVKASENWSDTNQPTYMTLSTTAVKESATERVRIDKDGNVGIGTTAPTQKLQVAGNVLASGYLYTSDRRLKEDIRDIDGLESVLKLHGVHFHWKKDGKPEYGLIAQEVEEILPDLVVTDPKTGIKSVKYGNLVAPLIESVKELNAKIKLLQRENDLIKKALCELSPKAEVCRGRAQ